MKNGLHSLNAIANSLWMGPVHLWNIIGLQNIRNSEDSVSPKEQLLLRSYGGWIYNYLCNQCLSPLMLVKSNPAHGEVYLI